MIKKIIKFIELGFILLALMALMVNRGWMLGFQQNLQNQFYDYDNPSQKIVVVDIDEKSLKPDELGPLQTWRRAYYAEAIKKLNYAGAGVIGIDITFPDFSAYGNADDSALRDALKRYDNVVLAARYYFENGVRFKETPNNVILQANPRMGWINVNMENDGFVRRLPVSADMDGRRVEAFSLELARLYLDKDINIPTFSRYDPSAKERVPFMYINYFSKPNGFTHVSFTDLVKGNLVDKLGNAVDFTDKIVLIGPTAIDLQDSYLTPVSRGVKMNGVEIHANNIQTIITQKFLRDPSPASLWITLIVILVVNLALFSFLKIRYAIPLLVAELAGFLVAGIVAYEFLLLLNVVYPVSAILLSFVGAYLLRYILEQKERKFIEVAFGHYVNKSVVEQILKDPKMLELGGAKRELSVFFSDIANFTTLSEKMDPTELVKFLNEYLKEMTTIILDQKGTLDKYEGDAIMAFWNAPLALHDHAKYVCHAALANQKRLAQLRKKWKKEGKPEIFVRIGINTGPAIVGNMGSEDRFDYTAIGDTVNLGSRLEGINKQYKTDIIVSEATYELIKDEFACRELDLIRVKGKNEPVRIYELLGLQKDLAPVQAQLIKDFESALKLYREKNFAEAKEKFSAIKDDGASEIFVQRCEVFVKSPPTADWDGVYTFTTK